MTMNLKKDFILTSFNHRLFALPAFCGLFLSMVRHLANFPIIQKKTAGIHWSDFLRSEIL